MGWSGGTFTRTNGTHTGTSVWQQDRDAGTKIVADRHDTNDNDLATGINTCITKTGTNAFTGAANLGSQKITALADGTAHTDGINAGQIQDGGLIFQATDTGSADAYAIALAPVVTAYVAGQEFTFKAGATSTGASTLNVNGVGVKNIKKKNDQAIAAGDIEANAIIKVIYDGTSFQMLSQLATTASVPDSTASVKGIVIVAGTSPVSVGYSSGTATVALGTVPLAKGGTGATSLASANIVATNAQNTFTKAQVPSTYTAALSATSGVLDYDTYQTFIITLAAGSNTLAAPTTEASQIGQSGVMIFVQPSSGAAATISLHADYETAEAAGLTISSANNDYDVVPYIIKADNSVLLGTPQLNFG